jgi:hypothetical protein
VSDVTIIRMGTCDVNRVTLGGEVGVTTRYTVEGVDPGAMQ